MSSKRFSQASQLFSKREKLPISEALSIFEEYGRNCAAKFDETVEIAFRLGIDPRHSDQMVRGSVPMPCGLGKTVKVWAFVAEGEEKEALKFGADRAGFDDLVEEINSSGITFDRCVATPAVMSQLAAKLGRVLGRQKMMPNPKLGTVGTDLEAMISSIKAGSVEFKNDKTGIVHAPVGKISFGADKLKQNIIAFYNAIIDAKPKAVKKMYIASVNLSASQSPSLKIDVKSFAA